MKPREIDSQISNRRAHGGVVGLGHAALSGFSLAKRKIPFASEFTIDKNGGVFYGHMRLPTTSVRSSKGVDCLAVSLDYQRFTQVTEVNAGGADVVKLSVVPEHVVVGGLPMAVWRILSEVWYDNKLILPRDGNAMNWHADNVVVLEKITNTEEFKGITDIDEILLICVKYFRENVGCWQMAEKSGLVFYSRDQFASLIRDILWAGVK